MGFRTGSFATVWDVSPKTTTNTVIRLSISRKNKQTEKYEDEFSGFVSFVGTVNASNAARMKKGDRIKLGDVDVTTSYIKEKNATYTNYKCFGFDIVSSISDTSLVEEVSETIDLDSDDGGCPF